MLNNGVAAQPSLQEEFESRQMLFRELGDPMASFTAQLQASTASLVVSVSAPLHTALSFSVSHLAQM